MEETWKDIKGYEGLYQVSDRGNVKSLNYKNTGKERFLKQNENNWGYLHIQLCINGIKKDYLVHRLICEAFLSNIENKEQVNHKNGIKNDNRLENLEWCTQNENQKHAFDTGLNFGLKGENHPMFGRLGNDNPNSKAICRYTKKGEYIDEFGGAAEAQRQTGFDSSSIIKCCRGKLKSTGNFIWKYKNDIL